MIRSRVANQQPGTGRALSLGFGPNTIYSLPLVSVATR
jgi:hypothetical protein